MKKNILLSIIMLLSFAAAAQNYSGTCGDNLNWVIDTETYTLTISGTGEMYDYQYKVEGSYAPWFEYMDYIDHIIIEPGVTSIGNDAFTYCHYTKTATIPNTIISIGNSAFASCYKLEEITIPHSVTSIGEMAFYNCEKFKTFTIPNSVSHIGEKVLRSSVNLESVIVEDGNQNYDGRDNCNGIIETATNTLIWGFDKTIIPNTVTAIGNNAYAFCSLMTSIEIPNSVTSIGDYAFHFCKGLESITIPNSVTKIGERAFYYCSNMTSIVLPNALTSISDGMFSCCKKLATADIPNTVTYIGKSAFSSCSAFMFITLPESLDSIGDSAFSSCSNLRSITIPNSVTSLKPYTFRGCSRLKTVVLPSKITSIDFYVFDGCELLESVELPETVAFLGVNAFYDCKNLAFIKSLAAIPPTCENGLAFDRRTVDSVTLYVPHGRLQDYKAAEGWSRFVNIVELPSGQGIDENQSIAISVFPNPATNFISINCESMKSLEIYSLDGKQIIKTTVSGNEAQVDISDLNGGVYLIRIETAVVIVSRKFEKK